MLLPFYISVLFIATLYKEQSGFINSGLYISSSIKAISSNYEDLVEKNDLLISTLTIQSKVITEPYIRVRIPLTRGIESSLKRFNESLKTCEDENRYKSTMDLFGYTIESTFKGDKDKAHLAIDLIGQIT